MRLTRRQTVGLLGSALVAAGQPRAFAKPKKTYDLVPRPVSDGIWMIEGATEHFTADNGGAIVNCTIIETNAGAVIVDTGPSQKYGTALRKVALEVTGRGIAAAINTHHHPDHFFGNQVFSDTPIYALAETATLAKNESDGLSDNMYRLLGDWMRGTEVMPPTAMLESSSIVVGEREFRVFPFAGHTDADLVLIDEKTGTMIAGDLAFLDRAPTTPHANLSDWRGALEAMRAIKVSGIVPGHGPFDHSGESIRQTLDYLNWLEKVLIAAASDGFDMVEIMEFDIPERFAQMGAMPTEFHRSVTHLFPEIERQVLPLKN